MQEFITMDEQIFQKNNEYFKELHKPHFQIKQVGISSKLISDWTNAGLISEAEEKGKWREFSLVEAIWLKFIEELRFFGVSLERIKELRKFLFEIDSIFIRKNIKLLVETEGYGYAINELGKRINDSLPETDEEIIKAFELEQASLFASILFSALLMRLNLAFCFNDDFGVFTHLGQANNLIQEKGRNDFFQALSSKSFAVVNIKNLITKFFDNDKLDAKSDFYFGLMNSKEQNLLTMIRSGEYKQVIIKLENGSITQLRLTKKDSSHLMMKIQRLLKRGDFKEIEIIARDGKIVKFEEKDIKI